MPRYDRSFLGIPDTCIIEYRPALHSPSTPSISDPSTIGITKIDGFAFEGCSSLQSITIPDSVTSIGDSAFRDCSSLTGIWVDENNTNYSSDEMGVLFNKNKTQLIHAPGGLAGIYTIPDGVTSIGNDAFRNCSRLTSITIPNDVARIGERAFRGCSSLTAITIGTGVTNIGIGAFDNCSSLTSIVIPKAVRFIEDGAFWGCSGLREITISRRFEDDLERIFPDVDLSEVKINWL